jgi:hypothetical protein
MATGWPMKTTYADGDVYAAQDVNDITGTINLLGSSVAYAAGKNAIINGDFRVWQRGTSFTTSGVYTADRWINTGDGSPTFSISQQTFTPGAAPVSGYEGAFFARYAVTTAGGSTYRQFQQRIEDVRKYAGQTVTVSFWARLNSGTVTGSYVRLNQVFGSGGSAQVTGATNTFTLTSSWQRFTATISVASISGKTIGTNSYLELDFVMPFTTTMSVDFWGVQVEQGSTATAFQTATGTIQGELAACQRYYQRIRGDEGAAGTSNPIALGTAYNSTIYRAAVKFPVKMRRIPDYSSSNAANNFTIIGNNGLSSISTTTLDFASPDAALINVAVSGFTTGFSYWIQTNQSTSFIDFSAEL